MSNQKNEQEKDAVASAVNAIVRPPILVGCEESGTITSEFRKAGYEAYSCDLKLTRGNSDWHFRDDIMNVIPTREWDLIILHPECTALALSGNRWYGKGMKKHDERLEAIEWTVQLWELAKKHARRVALENPASVIYRHLDYDSLQYIQPWQFGHGEQKKTGLALWNLPPLLPTNIAFERKQKVWKMPPGQNRKRDRSKTYAGIAREIVNQWAA